MREKADYIRERTIEEGMYIVQKKTTVRATAHVYNTSKSTVYNDLTIRLEEISPSLYLEVQKVLKRNKDERSSRGGKAKVLKTKMNKN